MELIFIDHMPSRTGSTQLGNVPVGIAVLGTEGERPSAEQRKTLHFSLEVGCGTESRSMYWMVLGEPYGITSEEGMTNWLRWEFPSILSKVC